MPALHGIDVTDRKQGESLHKFERECQTILLQLYNTRVESQPGIHANVVHASVTTQLGVV